MCAEQDVSAVTNGFSNSLYAVFRPGKFVQREFSAALKAVWPGGVLFDCGIAHLDIVECTFRCGIAVVINIIGVVFRVALVSRVFRVQVGIGSKAIVKLSADEVVDRLIQRLTQNIPHSDFHAAENPHHGNIRSLCEAGGIDAPKERFHVKRAFPGDIALERIFHHLTGNISGYRYAVTFTDALDAVIGGESDDDPECAADAGRWYRGPRFNLLEFHG